MEKLNMNRIIDMLCCGVLLIGVSSCELFGLDYSKGADFEANLGDNRVDMTVLEFMENREDIFSDMLAAIEYAGVEDMYLNDGNTYILLTNSALTGTGTNSYFNREKVEVGGVLMAASSWEQYPKEKVAEMLRYHVVKGEYSYFNLTSAVTWGETYGEGKFDYVRNGETLKGDTAVMALNVGQDRNLPLQLNNFSWNYRGELAASSGSCRTTNLHLNNGYAHVTDYYLERPTRKNIGQE